MLPELLLTYAEAAKACKVSKSTFLNRLIATGKIRVVRFGPQTVRVPLSEITAWINSNLEAAQPDRDVA